MTQTNHCRHQGTPETSETHQVHVVSLLLELLSTAGAVAAGEAGREDTRNHGMQRGWSKGGSLSREGCITAAERRSCLSHRLRDCFYSGINTRHIAMSRVLYKTLVMSLNVWNSVDMNEQCSRCRSSFPDEHPHANHEQPLSPSIHLYMDRLGNHTPSNQ